MGDQELPINMNDICVSLSQESQFFNLNAVIEYLCTLHLPMPLEMDTNNCCESTRMKLSSLFPRIAVKKAVRTPCGMDLIS